MLEKNQALLTVHHNFVTTESAELIDYIDPVEHVVPDRDNMHQAHGSLMLCLARPHSWLDVPSP